MFKLSSCLLSLTSFYDWKCSICRLCLTSLYKSQHNSTREAVCLMSQFCFSTKTPKKKSNYTTCCPVCYPLHLPSLSIGAALRLLLLVEIVITPEVSGIYCTRVNWFQVGNRFRDYWNLQSLLDIKTVSHRSFSVDRLTGVHIKHTPDHKYCIWLWLHIFWSVSVLKQNGLSSKTVSLAMFCCNLRSEGKKKKKIGQMLNSHWNGG